jgi:hypothetical protein
MCRFELFNGNLERPEIPAIKDSALLIQGTPNDVYGSLALPSPDTAMTRGSAGTE